MWALAVCLWSGLRLSGLIERGRPYLYSIVYWVFVYIFLGLAPMLQLREHVSPGTTPFLLSTTLKPAMIIVVVGIAATEVGMYIARKRPATSDRPSRKISSNRAPVFAVVSIVVSVVVATKVGWGYYFQSRQILSAAKEAAWGSPIGNLALVTAATFPLVAVHTLFRLRQQDRADGRPPRFLLMAITLLVLIFVTINFVSSSRIIFGTTLLSLAVLFVGALNTPARVRTTIWLLLFGMIFVFPLADFFRRTNSRGDTDTGLQQLTTGDFDAYSQIANSVAYVDARNYVRSAAPRSLSVLGTQGLSGRTSQSTQVPSWPHSAATTSRTCLLRYGQRATSTSASLA